MADFILRMAFILGLILAVPAAAAAQQGATTGTGALVQDLAAKDFNKKIQAVRRLADTGDPRVVAVLEALLERKLYRIKANSRVVVIERDGATYNLRDPLTDARIGAVEKSKIRRIRTNNRKANYWKRVMTYGWTSERRARQAELIQQWRPWEQSTGPKTPEGKATVARNAFKGGTWRLLRGLASALREQRKLLPE